MTQGMTLKQTHRTHFLRLCEARREAMNHLGTTEGSAAFVALSVAVHAAKADVPKRMWPLVNRATTRKGA